MERSAFSTTVLMGYQLKAKYKEQYIENYRNNPLIESLPDIYKQNEVINMLKRLPSLNEGDKDLPVEIRLHLISQIRGDFLQPLPLHLNIELAISRMIRTGYVGRNPISPLYAKLFTEDFIEILNSSSKKQRTNRSTATSHAVIGISGIGKSTAVEEVLLLYPQVIIHDESNDEKYKIGYLKQIVWLKIECPFDGSRKSLCLNFLRAVDDILGTTYLEKFKYLTEEQLIGKMAHISSLHCIGLLVIDEIQRMKKGEEGQKTVNFFVEMHNKLGVPLFFVGTYKAFNLFNNLLANARRVSEEGLEIVDRMSNDKEFKYFLNTLWNFQYTKEKMPLTDEISEYIYDQTQGITSLVINLFMHSQVKAIMEGIEKLTIKIIKETAKERLRIFIPFINALRIGNRKDLEKYDDLKPDWVIVNETIKENVDTNVYGAEVDEQERAISYNLLLRKGIEIAQNLGCNNPDAANLVTDLLKNNSNAYGDPSQFLQSIAAKILNIANLNDNLSKNKNTTSRTNKTKETKKTNNVYLLSELGRKALKKKEPISQILALNGYIKPYDEFISGGSK
jgi:hypothetical protein